MARTTPLQGLQVASTRVRQTRRCLPRAAHNTDAVKAVVTHRRAVLLGLGLSLGMGASSANATNSFGSGLDDEDSPLIQELLARSKENKEKYDKERLDDYYKRNFGDYFGFVVGSEPANQSPEALENRRAIEAWMEKNKPGAAAK